MGSSRGRASFAKILSHFGEAMLPKILNLILLLKVPWPCFQYYVLYCYDDFLFCYMVIKIFFILGCIMSQIN